MTRMDKMQQRQLVRTSFVGFCTLFGIVHMSVEFVLLLGPVYSRLFVGK